MSNYATDDRKPQPPRPGSVRRIGLLLRSRWPLRFASSKSLVDVAAVHASHAVCTSRRQLVARAVERSVEHFVVMASESLDALALTHVPQLARAIDRARQTVVTSKVELTAGELARVALQREDALPGTHVPNLGCVIEGASE